MTRVVRSSCVSVLVAVAGVFLIFASTPTVAAAQADTGVIVVRVLGPDGTPLPGVMAVASGPVGTQTQYTGIDGSARFPGLYTGTAYSVTFSLDGFKTYVRGGLVVRANRTTPVEDISLELAEFSETINVTGESPVVDVRGTVVGTTYTSDLIDMSPTASGLWAGVLDHTPGVLNSLDVGGADSGQETTPRAWGSLQLNNQYSINGGDVTEQLYPGYTGMYYATSAYEEVAVTLAAQDIETRTPGVNMNMIVKSGSNDWRGGVKYFYQGEGLVSNNVDEELEDEGVTEGTPTELLSDLDLQAGGPIVRDRAWFFADYWNFELRKVVLGLEERDKTKLWSATVNVNVQLDNNNKLSGRFITGRKFRNNRGASRSRPYLGFAQDSASRTAQLQWQAVLNQNLFLDTQYSGTTIDFPLVRRWPPGVAVPEAVPSEESATYDFAIRNYLERPSLPTQEFRSLENAHSVDATLSWYVTGENASHDIKFGGEYKGFDTIAPNNYPNGYRRYVDSRRDASGNPAWEVGVPREVRLFNVQTCFVRDEDCWGDGNAATIRGYYAGLFVQDILTIGNRLTLTGGLRLDLASNWVPAQSRRDSPWCGMEPLANPEQFCAGSFEEVRPVVDWTNLVPRVAVVYDLMGDGRWALKFNYSRYVENLGGNYARTATENYPGREDWNWFDANGDGRFQFGEHTTFRDAIFVGARPVDPELTSPITNEFTFGVEHELADNILVSVTGIVRGMSNDTGNVDIGRPFGPMLTNPRCLAECVPDMSTYESPYFEVISVDPGNDGIIGTPDDGLPVPLWARDRAVANDGVIMSTNPESWGFEDNTDYQGVSFVVSKRWSNNWQLLASYDYGRGYVVSAAADPSALYNNRRQEHFGSRPHMFKVTGNYLFADPVGINLGLFVRANSGEPVEAWYSYDDALIEPPNSPYCCQGNQSRSIDVRGEGNVVGSLRPEREDFVTIVDIRAEKQFTVGRYGVLHFYVDVFNLFNSNVVTEFTWNLGPRYGDIEDILPPRVVRIGAAWDF